MTEKRFTMARSMIDGAYYIYDNQTDFQFPTIPFGITEIFCQKLNNISEENKQLKSDCKWWEEQFDEYTIIKKENEQLKKELDLFKPIIFESDGEPVTLYKKGDVE